MTATVNRIIPVDDVSFLRMENMIVDLWRVDVMPGASGTYVSADPRFVVLFDDALIQFEEFDGKTAAGNSVFYIPAGMPLTGRLATVGLLEHIDIHVDAGWMRRVFGRTVDLESALFLQSSMELDRLCALLAEECRQPKRPAGYAEALALSIMYEVFHIGRTTRRAPDGPAWLGQTMDLVMERLDCPPTGSELAEAVGMPRSQFYKRFKEVTGHPPHQWIMNARIEAAKKFMDDGAMLSQVAQETGFSDQAHFNRCFLRATGITPGRWVRRHNPSRT